MQSAPSPEKTDIGQEISFGASIPSASGTVQLTALIIIDPAMFPVIHIFSEIEMECRSVSKQNFGRPWRTGIEKRTATDCRAFLMTQGRVHRCFLSPRTFPASYAE